MVHLGRVIAAAELPAQVEVVRSTAPVWLPPKVDIGGAEIPVASMALALLGLFMARGVSSAREGRRADSMWITGTLAMILVGVVIEWQPKPGPAIAYGVGIGAGGIIIVDMVRDWFVEKMAMLFPRRPKNGD